MRAVEEWIGKNDNEAAPPRVKVRVFDRAGKCCEECDRPIRGKLRAEFDHKTALINGGENREKNLQVLCHECHGLKTKKDVAEKSYVYRSKARRIVRKPSRFACSRDSKFKKRIDGTVVAR